jgi:hypothetical protein
VSVLFYEKFMAPDSHSDLRRHRTSAEKIHEVIMALSDDFDYANPATLVSLPFPSLNDIPTDRFVWEKTNGVFYFKFMGRTIFSELTKRIKRKALVNTLEKIWVYGTSGSGKSHLLAALVCHLIRMGDRVLYLPDCYSVLMNPPLAIQMALIFAFHDTNDLDGVDLLDKDSMLKFISEKENLWIIVDQLNALEVVQEDDGLNNRKASVKAILDCMQPGHRCIFSASANEVSNREINYKQQTGVLSVSGGLSEVS